MISSQVKQQYIGKEHIWKITVSSFTNKENKSVSNIYRKQTIRSKCKFLVNQDILLLFTILGTNKQDRKMTNRLNFAESRHILYFIEINTDDQKPASFLYINHLQGN